MLKVNFPALFFILLNSITGIVYSQSVDLIENARYDNPPNSAEYTVTNASGAIYHERLAYTPSFIFNGESVLEIKTFSETSGEEIENGAAYIQFDDSNVILKGSTFSEATLGTVTLPFDPAISLNRSNNLGDMVQGSVDASVMLGPLPLNVTITVSYEFIALEAVTLEIGTFNDALKLRTVRTISLSGIPLLSQDRTEWHHASASMIQFEDNTTGASGFLSSIDPPLETNVQSWDLY